MVLLVAILRRMLLPNEGVRGHEEEIIEVLGSKRPELEELAFQNGLEVEGHTSGGPGGLGVGGLLRAVSSSRWSGRAIRAPRGSPRPGGARGIDYSEGESGQRDPSGRDKK